MAAKRGERAAAAGVGRAVLGVELGCAVVRGQGLGGGSHSGREVPHACATIGGGRPWANAGPGLQALGTCGMHILHRQQGAP